MNTFVIALILGFWSGFAMVMDLSGLGIRTALICGVIAGLLVGDVNLGFRIGATCTLMGIGFYTYGGATIPDFVTGAIFGTVLAAKSTAGGAEAEAAGLTAAIALSLMMTQLDILGRASTTAFQHLGDRALANNNIGAFKTWTLMGTLPWFLSRALPVFLGVLFIDNLAAFTDAANSVQWVSDGLRVVGRALPAVGFALLLSYMDIKKFWPFMVFGYVLFAFVHIDTIGLALLGAAAGSLFTAKGGAK